MKKIKLRTPSWNIFLQFLTSQEHQNKNIFQIYKDSIIQKNYFFQNFVLQKILKIKKYCPPEKFSNLILQKITKNLENNQIHDIFLIDANNICYSKIGKVSFKSFKNKYRYFKSLQKYSNNFEFFFICDRNIVDKIDNFEGFEDFYKNHSRIIISESGIEADQVIFDFYDRFKDQVRIKIISNDKFRDYLQYYKIENSDLVPLNLL